MCFLPPTLPLIQYVIFFKNLMKGNSESAGKISVQIKMQEVIYNDLN